MSREMKMTEVDCQYVCMLIFHGMGSFLQVVGSLITGTRVYLRGEVLAEPLA